MDDDIRDLIADDLFDPFDEDDESAGDSAFASAAVDGAENGDDIVGRPLPEKAEEEAKPLAPPEERIARLLEEMPGQKRLLLRLVDYCREAKSGEEMDAFTLELKENCYSVYSPVVLRELLEEAGAIEYLPAEGEREEQNEQEGQSEQGGQCEPTDAEGALGASEDVCAPEVACGLGTSHAQDAASGVATASFDADVAGVSEPADDPFASGGVLVPVDESQVHCESLVENGEEMTLSFLEIEETKPGAWIATEAGCAAVDELDDAAATRELLEKEPRYLDIYHQILDFCAQEEYGRSSKEIDNLVNDSPLLQEPRRYSGYFVSRLERQGALEWRSGWCVTDAGRKIMEEAAAKVQEDCHA